jgi:hypothetical protein
MEIISSIDLANTGIQGDKRLRIIDLHSGVPNL